MKLLSLVSLAFVLAVHVSAQPLKVHHLESEQEMSAVRSLWRDHLGYLWIGNLGLGLMRYDGTEIVRYIHEEGDETSLSSDFVTRVFEDSRNRLWVATRDGLSRFDRRMDRFVRYTVGESPSVVDVYEDGTGRLWALSPDSVAWYDEASDRFESRRLNFEGREESGFTSMVEDLRGRLWIAGSGVVIWELDGETLAAQPHELLPGANGSTKKFYRDLSGRLWLAARDDGLFEFLPESLEVERYGMDSSGAGTSGSNVSDVLEYPEGRLLIAVDQGGLNFFDKASGQFTYQRVQDGTGYGLSSDGLISFHQDKEGIIWIGASRTGVDYYNPKMERFSTIRSGGGDNAFTLRASVVGGVFEDADSRVWIGTGGGGLGWLDPESERMTWLPTLAEPGALLGSNLIRQIDQGSDGRIWVGTWNGGVDALVEEDGHFRVDEQVSENLAALDRISVWDIEVDQKDRLWVAAAKGGVFLYDDKGVLLKEFDEALREGIVSYSPIVKEQTNGDIIITTERALYRFEEESQSLEEFIRMDTPTVVVWDEIKAVYYVGTVERGVVVLDRAGEELRRIGHEEGLSSLFIRSLETDRNGDLWMGTNDGLFHYEVSSERMVRYDANEGLQGNLYFTNSSCRTRDGRLYFGGTKGVSSLLPIEIQENSYLPHVSIDRIQLFGEDLVFGEDDSLIESHPSSLDELILDWRQNFLKFEFSAVNMTYAGNNAFAYTLEGFDVGWTYGDADLRWANYTNVDPGEYVFRVKASNNDGLWNEEGASIRIVITPPFWLRPWFYAGSLIFLIWFTYLFIVFRERRLKRENARLEQAVETRTKVINEQKGRLAEKTGLLENQKEELEAQKSELEAQQSQLMLHKNHLEDMISDRTKELVHAKDEAESANRLKSQFLANLSHEVRTPLNAITGLASFLDDDSLDTESRQEFIQIIEENSQSLLKLIEGILDYSLLAAGEMELFSRRFELNPLLDKLFAKYRELYDEKGLSLVVDNTLEDFELSFDYDGERLEQILENLLSNALKFTEKGGARLLVGLKGNEFFLSVSDSGHGIREDELDTVFEQFVKLDEDDIAARRGLGLGLAISKSLAELMEGRLSVVSEYGNGSIFTLTLPCGEGVALTGEGVAIPQSSKRGGADAFEPARVLVVEDEDANYKYLEMALQGFACEVVWASDGIRAVEILKNDDAFDLVLLDIRMPGLDGYSVLEWIRERLPHLKVVAQTAFATKSDESRIHAAGFDGYLPKPIELEKLRWLVETFLRSDS
ncbi:hybrid sensor histidine kinase/response regulator [Pelagicoccus mobilis]|uniref:histidine kinase n=1 Tax=Pelagicoccus mobilis TaxID=415221 RepID=A0A934RZ42_9BACT|nr:hybrid sensor histidine kinase/response regulator [Pelagicoccus mobilis]MBK1879266.1 response regulator [Pelagicoccus mobilis]